MFDMINPLPPLSFTSNQKSLLLYDWTLFRNSSQHSGKSFLHQVNAIIFIVLSNRKRMMDTNEYYFLRSFLKPKSLSKLLSTRDWTSYLGRDAKLALNKFEKEGILQTASTQTSFCFHKNH
jgi:hypothetical protein